jgi:hypothetical protein
LQSSLQPRPLRLQNPELSGNLRHTDCLSVMGERETTGGLDTWSQRPHHLPALDDGQSRASHARSQCHLPDHEPHSPRGRLAFFPHTPRPFLPFRQGQRPGVSGSPSRRQAGAQPTVSWRRHGTMEPDDRGHNDCLVPWPHGISGAVVQGCARLRIGVTSACDTDSLSATIQTSNRLADDRVVDGSRTQQVPASPRDHTRGLWDGDTRTTPGSLLPRLGFLPPSRGRIADDWQPRRDREGGDADRDLVRSRHRRSGGPGPLIHRILLERLLPA